MTDPPAEPPGRSPAITERRREPGPVFAVMVVLGVISAYAWYRAEDVVEAVQSGVWPAVVVALLATPSARAWFRPAAPSA